MVRDLLPRSGIISSCAIIGMGERSSENDKLGRMLAFMSTVVSLLIPNQVGYLSEKICHFTYAMLLDYGGHIRMGHHCSVNPFQCCMDMVVSILGTTYGLQLGLSLCLPIMFLIA